MTLAFVALGLDHRHIYGMTENMLRIGARCLGYWTQGRPHPLAGCVKRFADLQRFATLDQALDAGADLALISAIPAQHLAAYQALPEFDVVMLVDQDPLRLDALAVDGIFGATDIHAALEADVDLIDICLPPHLHAPVAIAALKTGKQVLCEKPLARRSHRLTQ